MVLRAATKKTSENWTSRCNIFPPSFPASDWMTSWAGHYFFFPIYIFLTYSQWVTLLLISPATGENPHQLQPLARSTTGPLSVLEGVLMAYFEVALHLPQPLALRGRREPPAPARSGCAAPCCLSPRKPLVQGRAFSPFPQHCSAHQLKHLAGLCVEGNSAWLQPFLTTLCRE